MGALVLSVVAVSATEGGVANEEGARQWTNTKGQTIRARFSHSADGFVTLVLESGREARVALAELSEDDRTFVRERSPSGRALPAGFPEESRAAEFAIEGGPRHFRTPHFAFHSERDVSPAFVREVARVFEGTHAALTALSFGEITIPKGRDRFPIRFLGTASFRATLRSVPDLKRPEGVAGVFLLQSREVIVPYEQVGARELGSRLTMRKTSDTSTLVHEVTHQLLHDRLALMPVWLSEGIAEYLASIPYQNGRFRFRQAERGLEERLATRYGWQGDDVIRLPHPSTLFAAQPAPWDEGIQGYRTALLYTWFLIHDDQPEARGEAMAHFFFRLDEMRHDTSLLITDYNAAVKAYRDEVVRYNRSIARYREDFADYRDAVEAYNDRARTYNREVREGVAPAQRIEVGEEPRAPREPVAPVPPENLDHPPFAEPGDLLRAVNRHALPSLVRGRSFDEMARRIEEAYAGRRIDVRVDPPPVLPGEAVRTLRSPAK